jgi:cell division transport system permease protein
MNRKLITFTRIVRTGVVNFFRNISLAVAAMAVMVVTLTIILLSLVVNTTLSQTINQITEKIDVSVYLKDGVTSQQKDKLVAQLKDRPNVASVKYLSKEDALKAYRDDNKNNPQLLQAINQTDNPLPATIRVKPVDLNKVDEIKQFLDQPAIKAQQSETASYNGQRKQAIDNISHAANILRRVGIAGVILFAVVSVLIIFNTIQMAIFNRRDEISIMRLLGANTWYIRGPFVVESIIYGLVSGALSILIIHSLFVASATTLQASSLGLLNIGYAKEYFTSHFVVLTLLQLCVGMFIGALSSIIATRRYLKFKMPKK